MHYFVAGVDEICMMASDVNTHVIGSSDRKKDKKKSLDSRASSKMNRTRNINGDTGPTFWTLKRERN